MVYRQEFKVRSFLYMLILFVLPGITSSAFCNDARDNVETMLEDGFDKLKSGLFRIS